MCFPERPKDRSSCFLSACGEASPETRNDFKTWGPNELTSGTSAASRTRATTIRPILGTLLRGGNHHAERVVFNYIVSQTSQPIDLLPFLAPDAPRFSNWSVCAFGRQETPVLPLPHSSAEMFASDSRTISICPAAASHPRTPLWSYPPPHRFAAQDISSTMQRHFGAAISKTQDKHDVGLTGERRSHTRAKALDALSANSEYAASGDRPTSRLEPRLKTHPSANSRSAPLRVCPTRRFSPAAG